MLWFIKIFLFHDFDMPLIKGLEISAWSQSSRARLTSFHLSLYWKHLKLWKSQRPLFYLFHKIDVCLEILLRWLMTGILHGLAIFFVVITSPFSLFFVIHRVIWIGQKQGNYSLRRPPKLTIPQAVIGQRWATVNSNLYKKTCMYVCMTHIPALTPS